MGISPNRVREICPTSTAGRTLSWGGQPTARAYRIGELKNVAVPVIIRAGTWGERTGRMV
jgi:hypothetical protein